jgi:DNA-binding transcriptional ArsR family regulator
VTAAAAPLSWGAIGVWDVIRSTRRGHGGTYNVSRKRVARMTMLSARQVSRYLSELRNAGILEVRPPRKVRTERGWRSVGFNVYRFTVKRATIPNKRRSRRGDTFDPSPLKGVGKAPRSGWVGAPQTAPRNVHADEVRDQLPPPGDPGTYAAGIAAARQALRLARNG